jgi:nicotinamidase-related amidase
MMLKIKDAVLVVVDIQGKLATLMDRKEEFYENVVRIIKGAQVLELPIIWNEQLPDKLGSTIDKIKNVLPGQSPLIKRTFSCCGNPDFMSELKAVRREQVILAGMETHVCVYQTALDLLDEGYEVYVVADAVSSRSAENKRFALDAMRDAGARITSVEMALFSMLRVAEGDRFRQVLNIVK